MNSVEVQCSLVIGVPNLIWRGGASWKASWKKLHIKLRWEVSRHGGTEWGGVSASAPGLCKNSGAGKIL